MPRSPRIRPDPAPLFNFSPGLSTPGTAPPDGAFKAGVMQLGGGRTPARRDTNDAGPPARPAEVPDEADAPPPPPTPGAPWAKQELGLTPPPPVNHPMMVYSASARYELAKKGLPTSAEGVRVFALGESPNEITDHPGAVVRSIAGPIGLGQKADVRLYPSGDQLPPDYDAKARAEWDRRGLAAARGQASLDDTVKAALDDYEGQIWSTSREIKAAQKELPSPPDGKTTVVTLSHGTSPVRSADDAAASGLLNRDSPLWKDVNAERKANGLRPLDYDNPADVVAARRIVAGKVADKLNDPAVKKRIDTARDDLTKTVADARKQGMVLFAGAGNDHDKLGKGARMPESWDKESIAGIPGLTMVGATDIRKPLDPKDDQVGVFSNDGADISAPGVNMPVGRVKNGAGNPVSPNVDGTSFASPYVAGIAALMIKANPKITPDQIDAILRDPTVAKDIRGTTRDGAGAVDPVAAVEAARALAVKR
jgi:hypothetical protein